ncbi:hypothetical protein B0H10DRAFT_2311693 [Mycena sp. CBHHK59/15]|nr:hypothetical protein B0H10DRAFT_2311693 [Mycena sp. CBHHK59/15]
MNITASIPEVHPAHPRRIPQCSQLFFSHAHLLNPQVPPSSDVVSPQRRRKPPVTNYDLLREAQLQSPPSKKRLSKARDVARPCAIESPKITMIHPSVCQISHRLLEEDCKVGLQRHHLCECSEENELVAGKMKEVTLAFIWMWPPCDLGDPIESKVHPRKFSGTCDSKGRLSSLIGGFSWEHARRWVSLQVEQIAWFARGRNGNGTGGDGDNDGRDRDGDRGVIV